MDVVKGLKGCSKSFVIFLYQGRGLRLSSHAVINWFQLPTCWSRDLNSSLKLMVMANVLKFWRLLSFFSQINVGFQDWNSQNACQNREQGRPWLYSFIRGSLIWVCYLSRPFWKGSIVFKIRTFTIYCIHFIIFNLLLLLGRYSWSQFSTVNEITRTFWTALLLFHYVPPTEGNRVALYWCDINWISGWILTILILIHCLEGLDFEGHTGTLKCPK